jgi:hypothetical protein
MKVRFTPPEPFINGLGLSWKDTIQLTPDKIYDVIIPEWELPGLSIDGYYYISNDESRLLPYPKDHFIELSDEREKKLNQLL